MSGVLGTSQLRRDHPHHPLQASLWVPMRRVAEKGQVLLASCPRRLSSLVPQTSGQRAGEHTFHLAGAAWDGDSDRGQRVPVLAGWRWNLRRSLARGSALGHPPKIQRGLGHDPGAARPGLGSLLSSEGDLRDPG